LKINTRIGLEIKITLELLLIGFKNDLNHSTSYYLRKN